MPGPINHALRLRNLNDLSGIPDETAVVLAAERLGLAVKYDPLCPSLKGLLIHRSVYVRDDLPGPEAAFVVAHELGHAAMRHGNMLYLTGAQPSLLTYQRRRERDAMAFALVFVLGYPFCPAFDDRLEEAVRDGVPAWCLLAGLRAVAALQHDQATRMQRAWSQLGGAAD